MPNFGDLLLIFQILVMERTRQTKLLLRIKYKMNMSVFREGGFLASVLGREVNIKVWVHFFIGDTEGNNKWLGHYPGA